MSLAFSDTTNKDGIIQGIERALFGANGDAKISGSTTFLAMFTADINIALDRAFHLIFEADGRWQFDDRNHTDYPIITTNLVKSQRDYSFTTDANSNLILGVHKVLVANDDAVFQEMVPVDQQRDSGTIGFWDGQNTEGVPTRYDKTANGIFLDPIPSYNETNGLKVYISREASYFTTADTTKQPGFAGLYHEYLVLRPAWQYAYRNNLANAVALRDEMLRMEQSLVEYYRRRAEDDHSAITPSKIHHV